MIRRGVASVLSCALAGGFCMGQASAGVFYGVTNGGSITRIDTGAQSVTTLSTIHVGPIMPDSMEDLAFDSAGNLFAVRDFTDFNTFQQVCEGYRITNPATGAALLSATLGNVGRPFTSLAGASGPGSFTTVNNINGFVGTLNINTGAFAPVSGVPNGPRNLVEAVAVNPIDGQAYGLIDLGIPIFGTVDYSLIRIDLVTGLSTVVGSLGGGFDSFKALRFDDAGTLVTVDATNGNVCSVDTGTGHASVLFAGGAAAVNTTGLAFIPVPGPGAAAVLAFTGVVAGVRRRR